MSSSGNGGLVTQLALGGALTGIAYAVIPLLFGQRIEVSPFLLFAIVLVCNLAQMFIPEPATKSAHTALLLFFARLAVSALFSTLLVVIYRVALTLG